MKTNRKATPKERKRAHGFSLSPSLVAELKEIAKADDRSLSYIASEAIAAYVRRRRAA